MQALFSCLWRIWVRERMRVGRNTALFGFFLVVVLLSLLLFYGKKPDNSELPRLDLHDLPTRRFKRAVELQGKDFVVMGKKMKLLSGAIHYFRVPPAYWEDRLMKLKAMGLNTIETYVRDIVTVLLTARMSLTIGSMSLTIGSGL